MFAHTLSFDPTYGYDHDRLLKVEPAPEAPDFASFWRAKFAEAGAVDCKPTMSVCARQRVKRFEVFDISYTSLGGQRIHGWLSVPRDRPITRGLVISHGYGGRDGPDQEVPLENAAAIYPCARGIAASATADIPSDPMGHVLHGIASRDSYVHLGCAADIWAAATTLTRLLPATARRLDYLGASFGGGIGTLALPWDRRFTSAYLAVPSFGQHPIRLTLPCAGSGEAVRRYSADHPEVREVLKYFDSSVAARHLRIPTLIAAALFDPAVPPPGQFAVYNALPGQRKLLVVAAAHFSYPGETKDNETAWNATVQFLKE